jgi:primary-amine oxidase
MAVVKNVLAAAAVAGALSCSSPAAQRADTSLALHPLDPLSPAEITTAAAVLREAGQLQASVRVVILETDEQEKTQVAQQIAARASRRVARAVLYDWARGATVETRVDLQKRAVVATDDRGPGEPPVRHVILSRATEVALADRRVVDALRRRGVRDLGRLTFLGGVREGQPLERRGNSRFVTVSPYIWDEAGELALLEQFFVRVNLTEGVVDTMGDFPGRGGALPARPPRRNAASSLKPLDITQPQGPSFQIRGSEIVWDRWRIRFGINPRRGLEVFDVAWRDGDRYRPILYRGSVAELMTPYGDPNFGSWYPRDQGDYGITSYSAARAQAIVGADAPPNATFVPAAIAGTEAQVVRLERAVAVYERDAGVLWRHAGEASRARQLVLSAYSTFDNYDYLFHWIFSQDGAIDAQVQLTGVMLARPGTSEHVEGPDGSTFHFAHQVERGTVAPNHQHFIAWRLDFDVDGPANRVFELNTTNAQNLLRDRVGEWFAMEQRPLRTERAARRDIDTSAARRWLVSNNRTRNPLGEPTAYALVPGENAPPFQTPGSAPRVRAPFLNHHLWVTRQKVGQMYASGEDINLPGPGGGVAVWSEDDESLVDEDLVVWYTHTVVHLPRPEDWPIMPAHTAGFRLVPLGFFGQNPALSP